MPTLGPREAKLVCSLIDASAALNSLAAGRPPALLETFSPGVQRLSRTKNARRSGRKPIPGLVYSQKTPGIALRQAWTASMEAAVTCPELAIALRQFDAGAARLIGNLGFMCCLH